MQYKYPQIDLKKTGENIKRLRKLKNLLIILAILFEVKIEEILVITNI